MPDKKEKAIPVGMTFLLVDDIGLDLIIVSPPSSWRQAALIRAAFRWVRVLSLIPYQKKKAIPIGMTFLLVDDIGLEPMTFRTSSGCSSQLS